MSDFIYNDNGTIKDGRIAYNDNGTLKFVTDCDLYYNINDEIIKLPRKESLLINLDALSFSKNAVQDSSSYINSNYTFSYNNETRDTLGTISTTTESGGFIVNTLNKGWTLPDSASRIRFNMSGTPILNARLATIYITCKVLSPNSITQWRDLFWLNGDHAFSSGGR